jgi:hypothetical protein
MTLRRAVVAAVIALFVVVAIVDVGWLPLTVLVVVVLVGVPYAIVALTHGQQEWFGREEQRRKRR